LIERRYSTAELAAHSGLSAPTVKLFVKEGVLTPSIQRARGRGHGMVFAFADVLAAAALNALRFQNASARPLRKVVNFFRSDAGRALTRALASATAAEKEEPRVLLVTAKSVALDTTPAMLMKKDKTPVVYCLDAQHLVGRLLLSSTEAFMRLEFQEPGASGRVPRKSRTAGRRRAPSPATERESSRGNKKEG
jgi:hypothetical protein